MEEIYRAVLGTSLAEGEVTSRICYMPAGRHSVQASGADGKARALTVEVTRDLVEIFQAQLAKRLKGNVRPIIGFDHNRGAAAAIPEAFVWDESQGLCLEVSWTASGRQAVAGRDYSYFSPTWLQAKGSVRPSGIPSTGEIGSLTNDPAFEDIERLAAERHSMTEIETLQDANAQLTAERDAARNQNETLTAERDALVTDRDALRVERDALRLAEAEALSASAAREGRIAEGERPRWAAAIVRDAQARELLAALPARANAPQEPIHRASKSPQEADVLETYRAMAPGKEKDAYLRAHAAEILAAERASK